MEKHTNNNEAYFDGSNIKGKTVGTILRPGQKRSLT